MALENSVLRSRAQKIAVVIYVAIRIIGGIGRHEREAAWIAIVRFDGGRLGALVIGVNRLTQVGGGIHSDPIAFCSVGITPTIAPDSRTVTVSLPGITHCGLILAEDAKALAAVIFAKNTDRGRRGSVFHADDAGGKVGVGIGIAVDAFVQTLRTDNRVISAACVHPNG